jgi:hypothetical protein
MFKNENLEKYLKTSSSIRTQPLAIAEWNMNFAENILTIGNYRYRPNSSVDSEDAPFSLIPGFFDINDADNEIQFYTGATDASLEIAGGLDLEDEPFAFLVQNEKEKLLYSLDQCFGRFRPRSGINKLRYFDGKYTHHTNSDMASRPRYYMPSRNDPFKYWTSYRIENGVERGIANQIVGAQYAIDDAAPFVVYKEKVPANKIVVKMQTHVGSVDLGPFFDGVGNLDDPLFGEQNISVPSTWKIQYLENNKWVDAFSFNPLTVRSDNSPAIGSDGYVELSYGIIPPEQYLNIFVLVGEYSSENLLPDTPLIGSSYLVGASENSPGLVYLWDGEKYVSFQANYGWYLSQDEINAQTSFVKKTSNAPFFINSITGQKQYREFAFIEGIRIVVDSMKKQDATFDLIEISPRLAVDLTDKLKEFSVSKSASDLGVSGMPVGQLLASTGSLTLFDYDESFTPGNVDSIISNYLKTNVQVKLYEVVYAFDKLDDVAVESSYHVPIKYMYAETIPELNSKSREVSIELRDLFFHFEELDAPQIFVEQASLSYAISLLLDNVGFSNYKFLRISENDEPIIPYFFISPDKTVAEVLQDIAISTQTAMFFDETNSLVCMSKDYIMPSLEDRETDLELLGSPDQKSQGEIENLTEQENIANIIEMSSSELKMFNDGVIKYSNRHIEKTYGSLKQASLIDQDKTWIYKPVLLWEAGGEELVRSREENQTSSSFSLSAIPLNASLSEDVPIVINNEVENNIIDFGEGIYWLGRYKGYFFANGEIIRFDAVEYSVSGLGDVWISSVREYQNYFSKVPFNGKIYPTGRVKIFAEPNYEEINGEVLPSNGPVEKHGRGQFGTRIAFHSAGLDPYWSDTSDAAPIGGIEMESSFLFSQKLELDFSSVYSEGSNRGRVNIFVEGDDEFGVTVFQTVSAHNLVPLDYVRFHTSGNLPSGIQENVRYFVSDVNLSQNSFTVATSKQNARDGIVLFTSRNQSGQHSLELDIRPDTTRVSSFSNHNGQALVTVEGPHNLAEGDRVFFGVRKGEDFVEKRLASGIIRYAPYWVKNVVSSTSFTFSDSLDQDEIAFTQEVGNLEPGEEPHLIFNLIRPIIDSFVFVQNVNNIRIGTVVRKKTGVGELKPNTLVSATRTPQRKVVKIEDVFQGDEAAIFNSPSHRLSSGDLVRLSTLGQLPGGVVPNRSYYVNKLDDDFFELYSSPDLINNPVEATDNQQFGEHFVSKDLNYKNILVLSRVPTIALQKTEEPYFSSETQRGTTPGIIFTKNLINVSLETLVNNLGRAALSAENRSLASRASRNGIIKNFLSNTSFSETDTNKFLATRTGTVQSSALIMNGPAFNSLETNKKPIDFVSYVYKELDSKFTHFGTRMRIIGRLENEERLQNAFNAINYYQSVNEDPNDIFAFSGASAGMAIMLNPATNVGYYFEIVALTDSNVSDYGGSDGLYNVFFYKVARKVPIDGEAPVTDNTPAIPIRLWAGTTSVVVDDGTLVGQFRMSNEQNPSVYDLAVEYEDVDANTRKFYLYFNNRIIAVVDDNDPLPNRNHMGLFVRGETRAMFENIYAIANNYSQNTVSPLDAPVNSVFGTEKINVSESFRKYAMSGLVQSTYLSGIGIDDVPKYDIYFEEFGTIMREAAYFNVRYDKAYPALYAQFSPTFNKMKTYTTSGFIHHAYGAEFLVFNHTDTAISLDETSGNYLRIQGVSFTQETERELTVDDYFNDVSNFSNPKFETDGTIISPVRLKKQFEDIRKKRLTEGVKEFSLSAPYIQNQDDASDLMKWMVEKTSKPRRAVGLEVFGMPIIQLGDIVKIDYLNKDKTPQVPSENRFVVYNISYNRKSDGPSMTVYLSEVF